jgi:hypothetical protein
MVVAVGHWSHRQEWQICGRFCYDFAVFVSVSVLMTQLSVWLDKGQCLSRVVLEREVSWRTGTGT